MQPARSTRVLAGPHAMLAINRHAIVPLWGVVRAQAASVAAAQELRDAALRGDVARLATLLQSGVSVNARDEVRGPPRSPRTAWAIVLLSACVCLGAVVWGAAVLPSGWLPRDPLTYRCNAPPSACAQCRRCVHQQKALHCVEGTSPP